MLKRYAYKLYILLIKYLHIQRDRYERPEVLRSITARKRINCGRVYVSCSFDNNNQPREVFFQSGSQGCRGGQEGLGRMVSMLLRYNVPLNEIIEQLHSVKCAASMRAIGRAEAIDKKHDFECSCSGVVAKILEGK